MAGSFFGPAFKVQVCTANFGIGIGTHHNHAIVNYILFWWLWTAHLRFKHPEPIL